MRLLDHPIRWIYSLSMISLVVAGWFEISRTYVACVGIIPFDNHLSHYCYMKILMCVMYMIRDLSSYRKYIKINTVVEVGHQN